jgi:transcriptional regulator
MQGSKYTKYAIIKLLERQYNYDEISKLLLIDKSFISRINTKSKKADEEIEKAKNRPAE